MKVNKTEYAKMVSDAGPKSHLLKNCCWAFVVGGTICVIGEALYAFYKNMGFVISDARLLSSITLVGLSALFTALGWYQKLAKRAGAGTLVPITGFANAVVSPAMEFKADDRVIIGTSQKHHEIKVDVLV